MVKSLQSGNNDSTIQFSQQHENVLVFCPGLVWKYFKILLDHTSNSTPPLLSHPTCPPNRLTLNCSKWKAPPPPPHPSPVPPMDAHYIDNGAHLSGQPSLVRDTDSMRIPLSQPEDAYSLNEVGFRRVLYVNYKYHFYNTTLTSWGYTVHLQCFGLDSYLGMQKWSPKTDKGWYFILWWFS
jgi:hypothetical protein